MRMLFHYIKASVPRATVPQQKASKMPKLLNKSDAAVMPVSFFV
jgi:hypothetical protein